MRFLTANLKDIRQICLISLAYILPAAAFCQKAYFTDGYHGGIYGHIPEWQTRFMVDKLNQYPDWKINLELEPESWDTIRRKDFSSYQEFQKLMTDQSSSSRIEYTNPAYAQSYMYNISGESVIRQFEYGIRKLREHFPEVRFSTYAVEEPCFTSCLPEVLTSFGFKYLVLKNPNTCWGGYARAFGGELLDLKGPDGTGITTVPRYGIEKLKPKSTWETIAASNSDEYVHAAFSDGIAHPVGMCYQDAGWKNGPWLGDGNHSYKPTEYTTWRNYFENVVGNTPKQDWTFSQEDVLPGLVWGAQVLQRIAQQVRVAENQLVTTEKLTAMSGFLRNTPWPKNGLDEAWRNLMLAQHHDCWIVPYNGKPKNTWADKVVQWTGKTGSICDSIQHSIFLSVNNRPDEISMKVFNTMAIRRNELVSFPLPEGWDSSVMGISAESKKATPIQIISDQLTKTKYVLFSADVPSFGFSTYILKKMPGASFSGVSVMMLNDGTTKLESDLYTIIIDPAKGGTIKSLVAKKLGNKEFVDPKNERRFNELRGNFYNEGGFHSSTETRAKVSVLENGPLQVKVSVQGQIASHPFTQEITLTQDQPRIDFNVTIDWKENTGIGEFESPANYKAEERHKAFYDDRYKLLALFPLNLASQKVYKNAPFDVTESRLENTFFSRWDSIKNNVILNWVDVTDGQGKYGMAMLTDHTTSYAHGQNFPLGLTLQYSGGGLFYRNYFLNSPTSINYALIPHQGKWDDYGLWTDARKKDEPLMAVPSKGISPASSGSVISFSGKGWELSSLTMEDDAILVRIFNAEGSAGSQKISFSRRADKVLLVELNGQTIRELPQKQLKDGTSVELSIPRFGIRTLKFIKAK